MLIQDVAYGLTGHQNLNNQLALGYRTYVSSMNTREGDSISLADDADKWQL
jgi:hypothetical protein